MKWDDSLLVGIDKFDAQHKNFFHILDKLEGIEEPGKEAIAEAIDSLIRYVTEHFHEEESLMLSLGYPGYEEHMVEHHKLMEKAQRLYAEMDSGCPPAAAKLKRVLEDWIRDHIISVDQAYVPFFKEKGRAKL